MEATGPSFFAFLKDVVLQLEVFCLNWATTEGTGIPSRDSCFSAAGGEVGAGN